MVLRRTIPFFAIHTTNSFLMPCHKVSPRLHMYSTTEFTPRQKKFASFISSSHINLIVATGPAGTGKTFISCNTGKELLKEKVIDKIVVTRPSVTLEDEDLGFLPGDLQEKFSPFTKPVFEYLNDPFFSSKLKSGQIEASPLGFLRGRTFHNTLVIADEMQNATPKQMLMLLTRLGQNSKIIITGDVSQCDLDEEKEDGLSHLLNLLDQKYTLYKDMLDDGIATVEMNADDCKRSVFVKNIIELYNEN